MSLNWKKNVKNIGKREKLLKNQEKTSKILINMQKNVKNIEKPEKMTKNR